MTSSRKSKVNKGKARFYGPAQWFSQRKACSPKCNKKGAHSHPALVLGDRNENYFSMTMTSTGPQGKKQKKKVIKLADQKTETGGTVWIRKGIDEDPKRMFFGPTGNVRLTESETSQIQSRIDSKKKWIDEHKAQGAPANRVSTDQQTKHSSKPASKPQKPRSIGKQPKKEAKK